MNLFQKMMGGLGMRRIDLTARTSGGGGPLDAGVPVNERSSMGLSGVWGCVGLLAGTISSLPFEIYQKDRAGRQAVLTHHPLYKVLHDSPNADQTALDFWDFITQSIELWGNAYARIDRLGGKVIALTPVRPELVSVRREMDGTIRYRWTERSSSYDLGEEDVFHVRGPGGDPLGGMLTLSYARQTFSLALATNETASAMFRNGMKPSGILKFKDWLSSENRKVAETSMVEKFLGSSNAGRPFIAEGGVDWTPLSITPEDAQMLQSRGFSIEEICRFFQVPPVLIQHSSATTSWPTGVEQQVLSFQKFTLRRRLKRIEQAVAKQLLSEADRVAGVRPKFNLEGLLRGDSAGRTAFYSSGLGDGWLTINEVRALENLPPIAGGDVPRIQKQYVPITAIEGLINGDPPGDG